LLANTNFNISTEIELKDILSIPHEKTFFNDVISQAYYSIFYAAKAYLLNNGIKTMPPEEHKKTYKSFKKFVQSGKIDKELLEIYETESEKAEVLLKILFEEKRKRGIFTYNVKSEANIPSTKESIGKHGEDLACRYLVKKGYRILTRNYRKPWGEIDIVGKAKDGTLVFFEVKTIKAGIEEGLQPEDNLTAAKLKKLKRVCATFTAKYPEMVDETKGWRIDLVAIEILGEIPQPQRWWQRLLLTNHNKDCIVRYYENI
jgi:putative endonuclease